MGITLAREIAYDAFVEVMDHKRKPEEVLDAAYEEKQKALKRLDRAFIKEVVYGGLRWYSKIFWILQHTSRRDLNSTTPQIRAALILGTYQIYYMDKVPDRAAVNESVEYVRKKGQANACSFVNGILRQIARRAEYFAKPDKEKEPIDYLSLQFAHPKWIVKRWSEHFNFEKMETMLSMNNEPPPLTARVNTMEVPTTEAYKLQQDMLRLEKTHTDKRNLRCSIQIKDPPKFGEGSLFAQGKYTIQDEASQLIGFLVDPKPGELIIDCCAGPGGKLSHIYELAEGQANIVAIDRSKQQFQRAQETMQRLKHEKNVTWVQEDYLNWKTEQKADKILLDAPCSGLGVLRRHPEGKWHKDEQTILTLAQKQRELLNHAIRQLKVGGVLVYSVCSFEPEETVDQLRWLVTNYEGKFEILTPVAYLPDYFKRYVSRDNVLSIYSGNQDDMDGFGAFMVKLKKEI